MKVENRSEGSRFFTRNNMKFAGDTMANYGVRKTLVRTNYDANDNWVGKDGGMEVEAWELYRKRPVKMGLQSSSYFACDDFRQVHPAI